MAKDLKVELLKDALKMYLMNLDVQKKRVSLWRYIMTSRGRPGLSEFVVDFNEHKERLAELIQKLNHHLADIEAQIPSEDDGKTIN